ncbi:tetratricopeptide repeat protein [aff. Roholtiella sp. LEGE 12411]|nr:tetratricopeptide repeat protein [aff. Roholtiella sp. LEGE 12411]
MLIFSLNFSQQAIAEYTRAIEVDPNSAEAYFYRGNT